MQVFVSYPITENGKHFLFNNLAQFKSELLLKSIELLDISEKEKDKVLNQVFEILDSREENDPI